jgi:hypothetical protein
MIRRATTDKSLAGRSSLLTDLSYGYRPDWVFHLNLIEHDHISSTTKFYPFDSIWYKTKGYFIEPGELGIGLHWVGVYVSNPDGTELASGGHDLEIVSHEEHLARLTAGTWFNHPD